MPTYSTLGEEKVKSADVAFGKGAKVFDLATDVNLVTESPGGLSLPRFMTVLTAGTLVGTNDTGAALTIPAVFAAGTHVPYIFSTLLATSTATVVVGW